MHAELRRAQTAGAQMCALVYAHRETRGFAQTLKLPCIFTKGDMFIDLEVILS